MSSDLPLILIEGVLVFGGALVFGWWQLRSVERDRRALLRQRETEVQRSSGRCETATGRAGDASGAPTHERSQP